MAYSFLGHPDCVKFRAEGATIEEMFVSASEALDETVRGDIKILEQEEREFELVGSDSEELLFKFLSEFLSMLKEGFLVARIKSIAIEKNRLRCLVVGDSVENYKFTSDVKRVGSGEMFVREIEKGFECQVVLEV